MASFCTTINCMDGRVQLPVIHYLKERFGADYIDSITEPGPVRILAEQTKTLLIESIFARLTISVESHKSRAVAVVGHHDCAGNPAPKEEQLEQIAQSIRFIKQRFNSIQVIGLWVDENWDVMEWRPSK
ncbi:MAG: hypothetical protein KJ970_08985 [Candidatus Eisenbacteria bacterium]|uniref:Carbonic anhydrase n=1 Tax=Eiseniibacteriota bacterium TaxID=2212470 RepID=A0A948RW38_UNCEI|nr:hypothetical protein [Candidatus Eisenbacteria bacterium]MBU1948559.1 hypothetical protein [Candidatus Eisenbacteria bacterium]MBU2691051.1 hypothetical protein [Candidatus Eisenbacteria bacterium]